MSREIFEYELKMIDEVASDKFSLKKIVKLFRISSVLSHFDD